ncbi:PIN domain-containing protein [Bacillaceae bacterium CLA-AA-H227]|uniref:PIN domain-containing protein n=1 Tax=Robertmurraya yapensis (ex Hitch et al 2024) TaxID=3133160 RepID=A0ACC6SFT6_9BACI
MLHVFLDSNIFYTDPFMDKNIHNRLLIELAQRELITIYVSEVVIKEVINNFEKKLVEHFVEIKKHEGKVTKMLPSFVQSPIEWKQTVEKYVSKLEDRFNELEDYGCIEIVPFSNDMLPELVDRSIKRTKPFSERKLEFRDAIIWFSYVDYVKTLYFNKINHAYFITKNTTDFTQNGEIHPDLQKDSNKFIFYETPQNFIQNCEEVKEAQKKLEFVNWIEDEDLANSPELILSMIEQQYFDKIFNECWDYVNNYRNNVPTKYDPDADYLEATDIYLMKVSGLHIELVLDHVVVSGHLEVEVEFDVSQNNYLHEPYHGDLVNIGTDETKLDIKFTLTVNKDKEVDMFDIDDIEQI